MYISKLGFVSLMAIVLAIFAAVHFTFRAPAVRVNVAPGPQVSISNVHTYWLNAVPADATTMCAPAIAFTIKNAGSTELSDLVFSATFTNDTGSVFAGGTTYWASQLQGELMPGASRDVAVTASSGMDYGAGDCVPEKLPRVSATLSARAMGTDLGNLVAYFFVNQYAGAFYVNELSLVQPPNQ